MNMRVPSRRSEKDQELKPQLDNYFTPATIERMKHELIDLETKQRPVAADEVFRTGQMGDLSENAAYQFAKAHLRKINHRILVLTDRLSLAIPIQSNQADGKVKIGSVVTVVNDAGQEFKYEIFGSHEADPFKGRISFSSPLGQALLGRQVGELVKVTLPQGEVSYTIKRVS
jgi:transcription elongation factor GreA